MNLRDTITAKLRSSLELVEESILNGLPEGQAYWEEVGKRKGLLLSINHIKEILEEIFDEL